jgi:multiple sugar transport system permease protein
MRREDVAHRRRLVPHFNSMATYAAIILGAGVTLFPLLYMVSTALKSQVYVLAIPPQLVPDNPTLENFGAAWGSNNFSRYFLNSSIVAAATVAVVLLLGSMMAHGLARYRFRGHALVRALILFFMVMPTMSLLVPQFVLATRLGLLDSLPGIAIVHIAQVLPLVTFILYGFMTGLPRELYDAALVDGGGAWRLYRSITLPLSRPAMATVAILAFLGSWDEYPWALTIVNSADQRTLPVGIAAFQGVHSSDWGLIFAASLIAVAPVIVLFVILQRYVIRGLTAGALKG